MSRSGAPVRAITAAVEAPIADSRYVPKSAAATGHDAIRIMATSVTRRKQRDSNVYQLSLLMLTVPAEADAHCIGTRPAAMFTSAHHSVVQDDTFQCAHGRRHATLI